MQEVENVKLKSEVGNVAEKHLTNPHNQKRKRV